MYLDFLVKVPTVKGKITRRKKSNVVYIEYEYDRVYDPLIIPGLFEPPVRTLRATIPENESHIFR